MEKLSTTPSELVWRPFLFHCNFDVKDIPITSQFYSELLIRLTLFQRKLAEQMS